MIVSRFAPAPTGHLLLGPVGELRAKRSVFRQSDRGEVCRAALGRLRELGLAYGCECTRTNILAAGADGETSSELRYPGTCAAKNLPETEGFGVRIRMAPSIERFVDLRHGFQEQCPSEQCGDMLARDRLGNWTYQFAVTADDLGQGITLVVRGDDLLASTGRQLQLSRLLGREVPPRFCHHGLLMKTDLQKLSKADGDTGMRDFRAGLIDRDAPLEAGAVASIPALVSVAARLQ
jgi:glutamyl-tRNA synthetase/glutamyl-Q tRNA(Asp) synthetase